MKAMDYPYGRVVLVTGASSGIGQSIAQLLTENGFVVYGTTRKPVQPEGKGFAMLTMDVTDEESIAKAVKHIQDKGANNRAENSHQPTRERERRMRGFKSAGHAQRFLSLFGVIATLFRPGRHLLAARHYREIMHRRFAQWGEVVKPVQTEFKIAV